MHVRLLLFSVVFVLLIVSCEARPWGNLDNDVMDGDILKKIIYDLNAYQDIPAKREVCWLFFTPYKC